MAGVELATAYLTLVPSLKGAQRSIASQLGGVNVSKAGERIGRSLSDSISGAVSKDALSGLESSVRAAEKGVRDAMQGTEDAAKRVAIAQQELAEAREKHGASSSQAQRAELRLAQAERQSASASARATDAQAKLDRATEELASATRRANEAAERQATVLGRVSSAAQSASTRLSGMAEKASSAGSKMSGVGAGMTAAITTPIAAGAVAIGKFAIETASAAETSEISFTTMLGSEEAALDMMEQLADFAAHTPFELSGLQTATRQLLAYGFQAEEVVPMLTAVGDATAALGTGQAGIESVTRALGQMQTRGKASAEEMLQLTEAGIPAWEYLARAIGTDTAGAMAAVSAGAVDADTAIAALTAGMEEDFGGMMESQSKTVAGLMSNLSDAIQQPLMELRNTDAYDHFASALQRVVDAAGPFVESLLPHLEAGIDGIAGLMEKGADAMEGFSSMSYDAQANVLKVVGAAAGAGPALTVVGGALRVAAPAMEALSKAARGGASMLSKLGGWMSSASSAASAAAGSTAALATSTEAAAVATTGASKAMKVLKGALVSTGIGAIVAVVGTLVGKLMEWKEHADLVSEATADADSIMQKAAGSMGESGAKVDDLVQSMADLASQTQSTITELSVNGDLLDEYTATIEELSGQTDLSVEDQYRLQQAVEGYNSVTGDSVEVTNASRGELSKSTEDISANAQAWLDNAEAQAYAQAQQDYLAKKFEAQGALDSANAALDQFYAEHGESPLGWSVLEANEFQQLAQDVDDASVALDTATRNAENFGDAAMVAASELDAGLKDAVQNLPPSLQGAGFQAAQALSAGIQAGSLTAEQAAQFMSTPFVNSLATLPADAQAKGMEIVNSLASAVGNGQMSVAAASEFMSSGFVSAIQGLPADAQASAMNAVSVLAGALTAGSIDVDQAARIMGAAATGQIETLPPELQELGRQAAAAMGAGIVSGNGDVNDAASMIRDTTSIMGEGQSSVWGSHLVNSFAAGMMGEVSSVISAAAAVAAAAAAQMQFTVPKKGPWSGAERGGERSGEHLVQNFARGMVNGIAAVRSASSRVSAAASFTASGAMAAAASGAAAGGTSVYIDGARINDDDGIRSVVLELIERLRRIEAM